MKERMENGIATLNDAIDCNNEEIMNTLDRLNTALAKYNPGDGIEQTVSRWIYRIAELEAENVIKGRQRKMLEELLKCE